MGGAAVNYPLSDKLFPALLGAGAFACLYACGRYNYLLFHTLTELFTVLTSLVIFVLVWHARRIQENQPLLLLGIASLFIAALDLLHALTYEGMGIFPGNYTVLSAQFRLAFRYLTAFSLLAAPLFTVRKVPVGRTAAVYSAVTAALAFAVFSGRFPDCSAGGTGSASFRSCGGYALSLLFLAAFALLYSRRAFFDRGFFRPLAWAILVSGAAEFSFARHGEVPGHILYFASAVLLYRAIVLTWVAEPSQLLYRDFAQNTEFLRKTREELEAKVRERTADLDRAKRLSDIGALAATVAHELRNPLTAIGLAARNIKRKAPSPDLARHLANIDKKVSESNQIINNLLFYSRLKPPQHESVDIFRELTDCVEDLRENCGWGLTVNTDFDALRNVALEADPVQLREVVNNVLNNARDAAPPVGGMVRVEGLRCGGYVVVTIRDNGAGLDAATLSKAFDPFFTTKAKGTGLGLAVCRQIAAFHGGSIEIYGAPGAGASVILTLPERKPEAARPAPDPA